ncbi:MAG: phosphatase PAP2 family protein [Finegoldia magna]|uniref:phosphatase PAP2 family protein n=1 Tax=Finegoldia magna TaxID=1260 RepID=UPI000B91A1D9|nr:phosphatase PAP2 family protein [Finegoldia magna]MDU5441928.1 phosphatase PAP2 family protein [Finegoldia magna]MDU5527197.1 phosphatase PAP2 family protein [Finegoldia magna]MDU6598939.1 phosphatase PAP2 family protein [Finegoldia magna]OXZ40800.1 hypothetical protein B9N58_05435 [Finegoldia magna]
MIGKVITKKKIYLSAVILVTSLIFGIIIRKQSGLSFEPKIMNFAQNITDNFTFYIFKAFTILGNFSTYFLILAISLYYSKRIGKNSFFSITLMSCLIGLIAMNVYKYSFLRVRPLDFFKIEQGGYSYVSGHSLVSTSFYFTLSYLLCSLKNQKFIYLRIIPFVIAFSRLVVGVHWPTDVFFGMLLGYVCYLATVFVAEKYIIKSNKILDEL